MTVIKNMLYGMFIAIIKKTLHGASGTPHRTQKFNGSKSSLCGFNDKKGKKKHEKLITEYFVYSVGKRNHFE